MSDAGQRAPRPIANDFWLATSGDDLTPRPPLREDIQVDVAILGGGFSGLWTAYYLLKNDPSLDVLIVEREICGYGASGRNGGWCSPRFPVDPGPLKKRFGTTVARNVNIAQQEIVWRQCTQPTPFSFPIITDRLREKLSNEKLADRIKRMTAKLTRK